MGGNSDQAEKILTQLSREDTAQVVTATEQADTSLWDGRKCSTQQTTDTVRLIPMMGGSIMLGDGNGACGVWLLCRMRSHPPF